jgi:hypothetical protein
MLALKSPVTKSLNICTAPKMIDVFHIVRQIPNADEALWNNTPRNSNSSQIPTIKVLISTNLRIMVCGRSANKTNSIYWRKTGKVATKT